MVNVVERNNALHPICGEEIGTQIGALLEDFNEAGEWRGVFWRFRVAVALSRFGG